MNTQTLQTPAASLAAEVPATTPDSATIAYHGDTGSLCWNAASRRQGMMAGTSPAMITVPGGYESAIQANSGTLIVYGDQLTTNTTKKMAPGTSPDLVRMSDGRLVVAYHGANGNLWLWSSTGGDTDLGVKMMAHTSPSIAANTDRTVYRVAYQSTNTNLTFHDSQSKLTRTNLGMAPGSSPDIALVGRSFYTAFQANTGSLWLHRGTSAGDLKLGMHPKTSPSISAVSGGFRVAFQANTGSLWVYDGKVGHDLKLGMDGASSPSIGSIGSGYAVAFQANTHMLWRWSSTTKTGTSQGRKMKAGTSPAVAATAIVAAPVTQKVLEHEYRPQETSYYCSAASAQFLLSARGVTVSQDQLAAELQLTPADGLPDPNNLARVLNSHLGGTRYTVRKTASEDYAKQLDADVKYSIDHGYGVAINVLKMSDDTPSEGHWMAIMGYDSAAGKYLISDPGRRVTGNKQWYPKDTVASWNKMCRFVTGVNL